MADLPTLLGALRLLIVAENPLTRMGLLALLGDQPGCEVIGQAADGAALLDDPALYAADAILWYFDDEVPPERDDLAAARAPVVALLADESGAGEALNAGARGALLRDVDGEALAAALYAAARGLVVLDGALAASALPERPAAGEMPVEALTPRELSVLQLVAEGLSNRAIAGRLHISEHTVKFHVNAILGKLGAQSRTEAVVRAARLGLIML